MNWQQTEWGNRGRNVVEDARLRECGLVHHERQRDHYCWIGPPEQRQDGEPLVKVLPLTQAKPKPNMEIRAHGETYLLPHNFAGGWLDITSPKGVRLIP